jgi:hypothetical protein
VEVSDGTFRNDEGAQLLEYRHAFDRPIHRLTVRRE